MMIDELDELLHPETLPILKDGRKAHYEGSIDKTGDNADWDWHLYNDGKEWVLFEQFGPGCVYNFVQHRFPNAPEPTFRFYFDGEETPRFEIKPSEFGEKYPFIRPLADKFVYKIRVVRSFVPMPFTKSCKITSDIHLDNNWPGGWGHVVYQTYSDDVPANTFNCDDPRYFILARRNSQIGKMPVRATNNSCATTNSLVLNHGEEKPIFEDKNPGLIDGINIKIYKNSAEYLKSLWIKIKWDNHEKYDVEVPFGVIFSNEIGLHQTKFLFAGIDGDGDYYSYFPMPYLKSAEITVENRGDETAEISYANVSFTNEFNSLYLNNRFGYFKSAPYYTKKHTENADSIIASIKNASGQVISSVITGYSNGDNLRADCEGDMRIHFDGIRTPQIESDGSESYACYGWGFCLPPQANPYSGYDGDAKLPDSHVIWSMTRQLPGESYRFYDSLHFAIESGGCNNIDMCHSGGVLWYGNDYSELELIGEYTKSEETMTSYFEGDDDDIPVTLSGTRAKEVTFTVNCEGMRNLVLRRVSDQSGGRQKAMLKFDDTESEIPWYNPDNNPFKSWLEDEYVVPEKYIAGKSKINITISPCECGKEILFNQFGIKIYGIKKLSDI